MPHVIVKLWPGKSEQRGRQVGGQTPPFAAYVFLGDAAEVGTIGKRQRFPAARQVCNQAGKITRT